jgi:hypothetical protein
MSRAVVDVVKASMQYMERARSMYPLRAMIVGPEGRGTRDASARGYHTEISKVYPYIFGRGTYSADAGENYLIRPEFQRRITQSPLMPPRGSDQPRPGGRFSACLSSHLLLAAPLEATAH